MIISSGNVLPDEATAHHSVRRKKQAASRSLLAVARSAPHVNCERMRRRTWQLAGKALFRGSQGRAEIAQFVVDLLSFTYGLGDFFAEQTAITVA